MEGMLSPCCIAIRVIACIIIGGACAPPLQEYKCEYKREIVDVLEGRNQWKPNSTESDQFSLLLQL